MQRDFEATGGASDLQDFSDFNLDGLAAIGVDSWDAGFVDHELFADHSGSDNLSQYEPSINMTSGQSHVGVDVSSFSGFNFRNTLRDATFVSQLQHCLTWRGRPLCGDAFSMSHLIH